jgi:type VI secretion system secreted protein Hcp
MAVDIFLELSNNIKGEAQDAVHKDKIDILAWSWGMSNSGTTHMATGGGGGKVNVQDISFTKYVDLSSNDLIKKCSNGTHIDTGRLTVRKSGGEAPVEYFTIDFEMIMVTSYSTGGSKDGLDRITENFTLNFRKFDITYSLQDATGIAGAETKAGWDVAANESWTK